MATAKRLSWSEIRRSARQNRGELSSDFSGDFRGHFKGYMPVSNGSVVNDALFGFPPENTQFFSNEVHKIITALGTVNIDLQFFLLSFEDPEEPGKILSCDLGQRHLGLKVTGQTIKLSDTDFTIIGYGSNSFLQILTALRRMSLEPTWRDPCPTCGAGKADHLRVRHLSLPVYNLVDPIASLLDLVNRPAKRLHKFYID